MTWRVPLTAAADFVAIVVFVFIGRMNHDDGITLSGMYTTSWPFLIGALVGWSLTYLYAHLRSTDTLDRDFHPNRVVPEGILIWVSTLAIGMVLRGQFNQGVAASFVVVATIVLGLFLIGWRVTAKSSWLRNRVQLAVRR